MRDTTSCTTSETFLNIRTPKNCFKYPKIWTINFSHRKIHPKIVGWMANSEDTDITAPDLGLHGLPRPASPKTYDHSGKLTTRNM